MTHHTPDPEEMRKEFRAYIKTWPEMDALGSAHFWVEKLTSQASHYENRMKEVVEKVLECTEDFDGVYKKFPAREAALIIQNRIKALLQSNPE